MPDANMLWIWLVCFTVFTLIIGAGLQFYQTQQEVTSNLDLSQVPLYATLRQGGAIIITLTFTCAGILFLGAAIRFVDKNRYR